jgi:hypothetical protein
MGYTPLGSAQEQACLGQVQAVVRPGLWERATDYIGSLSLASEAARNKTRLIQLRALIIQYEAAKQRLIDIVESHMRGQSAGNATSEQLRLSTVPEVLVQMEEISGALTRLAREGNMFAAEAAFRDLMFNIDVKRTVTLCQLGREASATVPDISTMSTLVQELKGELKSIVTADQALGEYIKQISK